MDKIKITKIGEPKHHSKTPLKSILKKTSKIKGVKDPSTNPPLKPEMKKHTIRMSTSKGIKKYRKTIKHKISKLKKNKIEEMFEKQTDIKLNPNTPPEISKKLLENAISAGFVSIA